MQDLREEIDSRLSKVNDIRYEPRLLAAEDDRLTYRGQNSKDKKTINSIWEWKSM